MNAALVTFLLVGSAAVVAVVYAFAGQIDDIDDIDDKTERELRESFPAANPQPSAESIQEPAGTSSEKAASLLNR